jgi:hypothetical protein
METRYYKKDILVLDENLGGMWLCLWVRLQKACFPQTHTHTHSHTHTHTLTYSHTHMHAHATSPPHQNLCSRHWALADGPLKQEAGDRGAWSSWFWFSFHSLSSCPWGLSFISVTKEVSTCSETAPSITLTSDGHCFPAFIYNHQWWMYAVISGPHSNWL